MNICLLGVSFDTTNNGVRALSASLAGLVELVSPNAHISLLTQSRVNTPIPIEIRGRQVRVHRVNLRYSFKSRPWEHIGIILTTALLWRIIPLAGVRRFIEKNNRWVREIRAADRVCDIFGGDSFSDIYGVLNMFMNLLERFIVVLAGKKIDYLPQTYGPYKTRRSQMMARFFLARARSIYSRDKESIAVVQSILKDSTAKVGYCPDVAFTLESKVPQTVSLLPVAAELIGQDLFGLNVSGLLYTRSREFTTIDYAATMGALIERYFSSFSAQLLLVPHTFGLSDAADPNQDLFACLQLYNALISKYPGRLFMVNSAYDQYEIKGIISKCSFFAGARMHACIAALSQGIPAAGIAYSKKFAGVFSSVGAGELVVDARTRTEEQIVDDVIGLYARRAEFALLLKSEMERARSKITGAFTNILS